MAPSAVRNSFEALSILSLKISSNELIATISDGRMISIPIAWFSRLANAPIEKLRNFEISPSGYGIHWPELDEDISIRSFLNPE